MLIGLGMVLIGLNTTILRRQVIDPGLLALFILEMHKMKSGPTGQEFLGRLLERLRELHLLYMLEI